MLMEQAAQLSDGYCSNYPLVNIQKNYGKSPLLIGKSTISMGNFPVRYVGLPVGIPKLENIGNRSGET